MMKSSVFILVMIIMLAPLVSSRHIGRPDQRRDDDRPNARDGNGADTVQVAGSRLPDCRNACGSCRPCRLVMVSLVCASLKEAETCPMAYKCMCKNKSYPVP